MHEAMEKLKWISTGMCLENFFFTWQNFLLKKFSLAVLPFVTTTECSGGNLRFLLKRNYIKIKLVLLAISNFFFKLPNGKLYDISFLVWLFDIRVSFFCRFNRIAEIYISKVKVLNEISEARERKKVKNKVNYIFLLSPFYRRKYLRTILFLTPQGIWASTAVETKLNYFYFSETTKCGISFFNI